MEEQSREIETLPALPLTPQSFFREWSMVYLSFPYFLDWASTAILFKLGGSEANPFLKDYGADVLLLAKLIGLPIILLSLYSLYRLSPAFFRFISRVNFSWFTGLTFWNVNLIVGALYEA